MTKKRDIHVVPISDGWAARREGADRASKNFDTKRHAQDWSRDVARREKVEVVTHGKDGRIRDSDSYGKDPFPPRDKKH